MELTAKFDKLPFYGKNSEKNSNKIIYGNIFPLNNINVNKNIANNIFSDLLFHSDDSTYDEGTFVNIGNDLPSAFNSNFNGGYIDDHYVANYKINVKIYWSDNKSHINDSLTNWNLYDKNIGDFPFKLIIKPVILYNNNKINIEEQKLQEAIKDITLPKWKDDKLNNNTLLLPAFDYNTDNNTLIPHTNLLYVPDNFI